MEFMERALIRAEKIISAQANEDVRTVVERIQEHGVRMLPVLEGDKLVGIFSLKSIIREVIPKGLTAAEVDGRLPDLSYIDGIVDTLSDKLADVESKTVREIMRTDYEALKTDCSATHVLRQIYVLGSPLPVVNNDGTFLGLITEQSMLRYLDQKYWSIDAKTQ